LHSGKDESDRERWARTIIMGATSSSTSSKVSWCCALATRDTPLEQAHSAFVPRETIHGFHNASSDSATILVMHDPAGFERLLADMQQLAARHGSKEERAALAARFDMIPVPAFTET